MSKTKYVDLARGLGLNSLSGLFTSNIVFQSTDIKIVDELSKPWNEHNFNLSNHDSKPFKDFEEALKKDIIIYDE